MAEGEVQNELKPLEIRVLTPGDDADITQRIASNEKLPFTEAVYRKTCIIVGNGPSANDPALWERLKSETITTVAVNNSLRLFQRHGLEPTYWACCDPQEEYVLDFIPLVAPKSTTYLVATKCPESLFNELASQGLKVQKWRLDDYDSPSLHPKVTCAVSITLVAQSLMRFKGFHRFEVYGWDCCFLDGQHHAASQPDPKQDILTFEIQDIEGKTIAQFPTIGTWIAELHDAQVQAHNLKSMGYELIVHGPGAVATLLRGRGLLAA